MDVTIVVYEGFDQLDAVGPHEVFGHARAFGAPVSPSTVALAPAEAVTSSHGLRVVPDGTLDEAAADLVVVPGGGWNDGADRGARREAKRGALPDALGRIHGSGVTVAGVCTGGMLLASAGLTDGRPAVTHRGALDDLRASGADVVDVRVVDDGDLLTAGGVTAGIDLALHVVEREFGARTAEQVATEMEYARRDDVYVSGGD